MSAHSLYSRQLYRDDAAALFPPVAHDQASKLFFTSDGCIGFGWLSHPLTGANESTEDKLNMLFSLPYPAGSVVSFSLFASNDIEGYIDSLLGIRSEKGFGGHPVLERAIRDKAQFLIDGTKHRINDRLYSLFRDFIVIATVKIPTVKAGLPSDKEWRVATELRTSVEKGLEGVGLGPLAMTQDGYLHVMGTILNWSSDASWRKGTRLYDPNVLLNEQVLDFGTCVDVKEDGLWVGNKRVKVLSPKRYPEYVSLPLMHLLVGDVNHGLNGVAGNFLATMNLYFPDVASERETLEHERALVNYQALGPIAALSPTLRQKRADYEALFESLDAGDRPVKMQHTFVLFEDTEEAATAATSAMVSYYRDLHFHVQDDRFVMLPLFLNALPFGADTSPKAIRFMKRHRKASSGLAASLAPIISDWKGTRRPVLTYLSRNGQIMGLDLFESSSNFNFVVAAQSGAGKSFWANDAIISYLSIGAKVYVIDVGRSYQKICEVLDGEYLVFSKDSKLCLNPFELVEDFEEEGSMLVDMIRAMASPVTPLAPWQTAVVQKTITDLWSVHGNALTVDVVAAELQKHADSRARDVGDQLSAFTSRGEFGRWFVGKNNVRFDKKLTVLELEELKGKPHLQIIVLLQLIYQITQDLYLDTNRSVPKLILIDEAWDLFSKGDVADFMVSAYRRARKYGGSIGIILQSISDLYTNERVGLPILENSAWLMLLSQKSESIDVLQRTNKLSLSPGGFQLLKTVQTVRGSYSEIFIYTSSYNGGVAAGIGRLVVSRFSQLLYTTDHRELDAIDAQKRRGLSLQDSINAVIELEGQT